MANDGGAPGRRGLAPLVHTAAYRSLNCRSTYCATTTEFARPVRSAAPLARAVMAGAPSPDSYLLACAFFYDEQFLPGFQMLLQDVVAAIKLRRVVALEAYGLRHTSHDQRFVGYLHELNLFNAHVLEGSGFSRLRAAGRVGRYRLELETLVATPRRSRAIEQPKAAPATIPA